jgi:OmpA-OmpF porin, OOP family
MRNRNVLLTLACLIIFSASAAQGQGLGRILGGAAKDAAKREAASQVDRKTTEVVRCAFGDEACVRKAEKEGKTVEMVDRDATADGGAASPAAGTPAVAGSGAHDAPGTGAWANYDFVPGERLLFADDFSADRVGNFPRRLEFVSGNMEIVELNGKRLLRSTAESIFIIRLPEVLPSRFTIEFDLKNGSFVFDSAVLTENFDKNKDLYYFTRSYFLAGRQVGVSTGEWGPEEDRPPKALTYTTRVSEEFTPVRIMADGGYAKMFVGEQRVANIPNAKLANSSIVQIRLRGSEDDPSFLGNIRVSAGGRELYEALTADGRVSTQGILFDTGSDRIRPESTPTLTEIGRMLQEHTQLRIRIEGHTDNVGSAVANQELSQKRAAAVRNHLIQQFSISGSRLESTGFGSANAAKSNDTAEGRQQNRRVELVRL